MKKGWRQIGGRNWSFTFNPNDLPGPDDVCNIVKTFILKAYEEQDQ